MVKFIVVEDKKENQEKIKKVLVKIGIQINQEYDAKYYEGYNEELAKEIEDTSIRKVYIMDIELDNSISGIEIAEKIREEDWDSEIVFVTSHDRMFDEVHRNVLEVFDFIERFINMEGRLEKDILRIIKKKYDSGILKIKGSNVEVELHVKNILYIEKEERKSVIHACGNRYKTNLTLERLQERLDQRFIRTHKGCIANKEHVIEKNYGAGYFLLDTGEKVNLLSKKYRKEIGQ